MSRLNSVPKDVRFEIHKFLLGKAPATTVTEESVLRHHHDVDLALAAAKKALVEERKKTAQLRAKLNFANKRLEEAIKDRPIPPLKRRRNG